MPGALSVLPRELRDRIYSLALDFNIDRTLESSFCSEPIRHDHRLGILMVSKRIHGEAKIAFFQTNEFVFLVDHACLKSRENRSVMGEPGFTLQIGHNDIYHSKEGRNASIEKIPYDMIPHMQNVHVTVGGFKGLRESDIVGFEHQSVYGPERPTYVPLMMLVHEVCALLRSCHQLHMLRISIRSIEDTPGSIEIVMDPIRKLRRIKRTRMVVWSMQEDRWVDWNLRGSYGRYVDRILALPESVEAPTYVGDEKEPNISEDSIFDIIGATWMGGTTFVYPDDSDDEFDDDDDGDYEDFFDDYDDYYDDYLDGGGMSDETPSNDSEVDWDLD